ncbi:hypothetical protein M378DRAFT_971777 [Amanita muscaria Koide BX008]|uniref:Uncharacterized protein n=1 Tax=Amanita muscaria (strain Koide BX008) TaxID=946122 RepID=A0A0C2WSN2_AMAMK|nr:hypothetical protein M378DRAFT_971777 [Amanita muscaria Koide BX008]
MPLSSAICFDDLKLLATPASVIFVSPHPDCTAEHLLNTNPLRGTNSESSVVIFVSCGRIRLASESMPQ